VADDKGRPTRRHEYPSFYEKAVPVALIIIAVAVVVVLVVIVGVATGLFHG
jgi:hypothetical protein